MTSNLFFVFFMFKNGDLIILPISHELSELFQNVDLIFAKTNVYFQPQGQAA